MSAIKRFLENLAEAINDGNRLKIDELLAEVPAETKADWLLEAIELAKDIKPSENYIAKRLPEHAGHDVEIVRYAANQDADNYSLECLDCDEVIGDYEL